MESRHLVVMMTDIQGFTRATSGMGREQVEELLALHEDLLVPVIREYGGTIVKGLGDAFLVTFESPTKGVQAGSRIQEVLYEHNSKVEDSRRLLVRVALNAGEVNIRDDDVFGEAVNITARVEGVCMAEQVTLTEAVFLLVDREAVTTEYLEDVTLKGIPFPVKLYRVLPRWLPEADRDLDRARSKPAATSEGEPPRSGSKVVAGALGLAVLAGAGAWWARPVAPAALVQAAVTEARWSDAWNLLRTGVQKSPSPELSKVGVELLEARLAHLQGQGDWLGAYAVFERFQAILPGVAGVSQPQQAKELGLQGVRALRASQRFEAAQELLEKVSAHNQLEGTPELTTWAEEDLRRVWEESFPAGQPAPEDTEQLVGGEAITVALRRLEKYHRAAPWAVFVRALRGTMVTGGGTSGAVGSISSSLRSLSDALGNTPELGARQEAGPAYRMLLMAYDDKGRDTEIWSWADPLLTRKVGSWITARLEAWANEVPESMTDPLGLLGNQKLRRNSLRLVRRRGATVHPLPQVHLAADIALLGLEPKDWNQSRVLEEAQALALKVAALAPPDRALLNPSMRQVVEAALSKSGAGISYREGFVQIAGSLGYNDLFDAGGQLAEDFSQVLERDIRRPYFKPGSYQLDLVKARLGKLAALKNPWRGQVRKMFQDAVPVATKSFPDLVPVLQEGLGLLK